MTTIHTVQEGIETRSEEIRMALIALTNGKTVDGKALAKNTINTMRHNIRRDQRVLSLIHDLIEALEKEGIIEVKLSEASLQGFNQVCYPEKGGNKVMVEEGDSILEIMEKYKDTKDLLTKVNKAAEVIGCKVDFQKGKIVKA